MLSSHSVDVSMPRSVAAMDSLQKISPNPVTERGRPAVPMMLEPIVAFGSQIEEIS